MSVAVLLNRFPQSKHRQTWIWFALLSLLAHAFILLWHIDWQIPKPTPRVELQPLSTAQLQKIRKQIENRGLLIDKSTRADEDTVPPKNARYFSDRNIRVEHEFKAVTSGANKGSSAPTAPRLRDIGLPLNLSRPVERSPSGGGGQYVTEKTVPEGSETLLNAERSIFYSFYARVNESLEPVWQSRAREVMRNNTLTPGEYVTVVDVVLDRQGEISAINHLQNSGVPLLDSIVDSSWRLLGRFPNPPAAHFDEKGELHLLYSFSVHMGSQTGIEYLPPERLRW